MTTLPNKILLPITFTAEETRKILAVEKTQTRRIINPNTDIGDTMQNAVGVFACDWSDGTRTFHKPRYRVGDVLWVQEPWRAHVSWNHVKPTELPDDVAIFYDGEPVTIRNEIASNATAGKLRPARFLPLRFARPTRLLVTQVRCERVNEISETDALAEGITITIDEEDYALMHDDISAPVLAFENHWNSLHPKPGERFEDGPWCFANSLRKL